MQRIIIDTNVYIDWINDGLYEAVIFQREAVKHLSAIVMMELAAGAFSLRDRRIVRDVASAFARVGRILAPTISMYQEAGEVLRQLQESLDYTLASAHGLANDVLIALSARSIGALVITQNERDFSAIQRIRPFKLAIVGAN
jgi:hypothetical protein